MDRVNNFIIVLVNNMIMDRVNSINMDRVNQYHNGHSKQISLWTEQNKISLWTEQTNTITCRVNYDYGENKHTHQYDEGQSV